MDKKHAHNWRRLLLVMVVTLVVPGGIVPHTVTQAQAPDDAYQEALDRIQEAKETGATELDLSELGLAELPPEIVQLTTLEWLDLSGNALSSLPPEIGQLTTLQELGLGDNPLESPPPHIVEQGTAAILEYLRDQQHAVGGG